MQGLHVFCTLSLNAEILGRGCTPLFECISEIELNVVWASGRGRSPPISAARLLWRVGIGDMLRWLSMCPGPAASSLPLTLCTVRGTHPTLQCHRPLAEPHGDSTVPTPRAQSSQAAVQR